MSIKKYSKLRKLNKTPEPAAMGSEVHHTQLRFVIQKHGARRLHYDLRLEMNGVLKSWAIPKGPSLNPEDKRLAIHVEDHPYEYKDFEGMIPKGNYGAGKVIIWDEGTYEILEPKSRNSNRAGLLGLKKGKLTFLLNGTKLKGIFSLIKMATDEDSWLLIKSNDEFISEKDILKQDKSVRSGLKLSQITDHPLIMSLKKSHKRIPKTPYPKKILPMLTSFVEQPFNDQDWVFEVKWDGYRVTSFVNGSKVKLMSRNQHDYTSDFKIVASELQSLGVKAVFDGEMVVLDQSGVSHFSLLQQYLKSGKGHLTYYIFDILWLNGYSLKSLPLIERKQLLKKVVFGMNHIRVSDYIETTGVDFYNVAVDHGLEGIVAKESQSVYEAGKRSRNWLKIKIKKRLEAIICGYTESREGDRNFGALILGVYKNHELTYIGHTGSGFNTTTLEQLKKRLNRLVQEKCPFKTVPETNTPATWVKPYLVCEIKYTEWTHEGMLRHPSYKRLIENKLARSIRLDNGNHKKNNHNANEHETSKELSTADYQLFTINNHRLKLTNLTKILWPQNNYTKRDLIEYYRNVSKYILPYLKGRPESLNRYPDGITGNSFFHKNLDIAPKWALTQTISSHSNNHNHHPIKYLICQNEATLIYMANLGCIEINPWLSRIKSLKKPDFCVIDLDPEEIGFEMVVIVARAVHHLLDRIKAANYCKTSGKRGLHICIPLGAKYSYEQSKDFAHLIAIEIHKELPEITSLERSPKERQGKVYIDYLQNREAQTLAAPYSVRPVENATVSTPLSWTEVTKKLNPHKFTIATVPARLAKLGDLWKPMMGKGINLKRCVNALQAIIEKS